MSYAVVTVPAAPVRKEPNHRHEMTNQLFFGEGVKIITKKDDIWLEVESVFDNYKGWLTTHLVTEIEHVPESCNQLAPDFLNTMVFNNQVMHIPMSSSLPNYKNKKGNIAGTEYLFDAKPINTSTIKNKQLRLIKNARRWLNAPYLWGGKTILGVDCSGFCQTQYKLIGTAICRDAKQQALYGKTVANLQNAKAGDLAFFHDKEEIVHVGILLGGDKIIHASGKVRIDLMDKKGIIRADTGQRTHQLKSIKRILL